MARTIKGTKDAKQFVVVRGPQDTRRFRCKKCNNYVSQVPDGQGGHTYRCTCGAEYRFTVI